MKITHYIAPRDCGKTTFAESLQKQDPSLLLIQRSYTITDMLQLFKSFRGKYDHHNCYTGIIIDEFIPFTQSRGYSKGRFLQELKIMGIEEVVLISTPDKFYNPRKIEDFKEMVEKFLIDILECENKINIIKTNFNKPSMPKWEEEMRIQLGEEKFLTDIKGEFLR